jgi:hypothetical protein
LTALEKDDKIKIIGKINHLGEKNEKATFAHSRNPYGGTLSSIGFVRR